MSENITHVAVCDDATRLASLHPGINSYLAAVMREHSNVARFGAGTRSADRWTADLITWAREENAKPADERGRSVDQKLAFVLGALTHRAADRLMKPILHYAEDREGPDAFWEATIHCDICAFREVYASGEGPHAGPFTNTILNDPSTGFERQVEEYFRVLWQRAIVGMHTFSPDTSDMQAWLDKFLAALQDFPADLSRYARIAAEWDPAKVKRYLEDTRFYEREDRLIRAARGTQRGEQVEPDQVVAALAATGENSSRYARALAKAMTYLLAASDLYDGKIGPGEAKTRFDVGVPELSLKFEGPK